MEQMCCSIAIPKGALLVTNRDFHNHFDTPKVAMFESSAFICFKIALLPAIRVRVNTALCILASDFRNLTLPTAHYSLSDVSRGLLQHLRWFGFGFSPEPADECTEYEVRRSDFAEMHPTYGVREIRIWHQQRGHAAQECEQKS
jgi:hypothetical protein